MDGPAASLTVGGPVGRFAGHIAADAPDWRLLGLTVPWGSPDRSALLNRWSTSRLLTRTMTGPSPVSRARP